MRAALIALLLAATACGAPTPEVAADGNAAASNTFAEMDAAATPSYDAANLANAIDPDTPVASGPAAPVIGGGTDLTIDADHDECGASKLQSLIGKPRSAIPAEAAARARIACTTCPVTDDLRRGRLNIFYDEESGIIRRVACF